MVLHHVRRLMLACTVALAVSPALADTPANDAATIARELMSPFCPGLLLADCQSPGAQVLRAEIRMRLEAGETSPTIVDDLAARYGASIRGKPAMQGIGALVWILPPALGVASLLGLWRWVCTSAPPVAAPERDGHAIENDPMLARVDQELLALD